MVLVLLNLSSAFDVVDHSILLTRLECLVGIKGSALEWFKLYLLDRSFSVAMRSYSSSVTPFHCGVPQASVLGPMLISLYIPTVGSIFDKYNIFFFIFMLMIFKSIFI